jgi:hypothetical protein
MPKTPRTAHERWTQFLTFVAAWVLAAIVASALLFYFTARPGPPAPSPEPEPISDVVPEPVPAPAPSPAPVADTVAEPPPPEPKAAPAPPRTSRPQARAQTRRVMRERESAAKVADHVREAASATEKGDYDAAIRHYESALELEPNNFEVKILRDQVAGLRALETRETEQRFQESPTELTAAGVATRAISAELSIELLPAAPKPGDPYVLRVRAQNLSNEPLSLTSVELVDTHASMKQERGRATKPLAQRLGPRENALLWEKRSDWSVADNSGAIVVTVTLDDGSRLSKALRW